MTIHHASAPRGPAAARVPTDCPRRVLETAGFHLLKQQVEAIERARSSRHMLLAVTFRPGREVRGEAGEADLWRIVREWDRAMCCLSLGFSRRSMHVMQRSRPIHVLLAQHGETTWHYHGVASVFHHQLADYGTTAEQRWKQHSPGGDMDIRPMRDGGWLQYIARKLHHGQPVLFRVLPEKGVPASAPVQSAPSKPH